MFKNSFCSRNDLWKFETLKFPELTLCVRKKLRLIVLFRIIYPQLGRGQKIFEGEIFEEGELLGARKFSRKVLLGDKKFSRVKEFLSEPGNFRKGSFKAGRV